MNIAIVDDLKTDSDRLVGFIDTYETAQSSIRNLGPFFQRGRLFRRVYTRKVRSDLSGYLHGRDHRNGDCKTDSADGP